MKQLWQRALNEREREVPFRARLLMRGILEMAERIAAAHQVTIEEMASHSRTAAISAARQQMWVELYATGHWSYPRIGQLFGRHHTSVIFGVRKAMIRAMKGAA